MSLRIGTQGRITEDGLTFTWDGTHWMDPVSGFPVNPIFEVKPLRVNGLLVRVESRGFREYLTDAGYALVCFEHGGWMWRKDAVSSWADADSEEAALEARLAPPCPYCLFSIDQCACDELSGHGLLGG